MRSTLKVLVKSCSDLGMNACFNDPPDGLSANNSINPFALITGEYVVHKKYGIGKFMGIRNIRETTMGKDGVEAGALLRASTRPTLVLLLLLLLLLRSSVRAVTLNISRARIPARVLALSQPSGLRKGGLKISTISTLKLLHVLFTSTVFAQNIDHTGTSDLESSLVSITLRPLKLRSSRTSTRPNLIILPLICAGMVCMGIDPEG
jgi:hypothetical protein